jgi:polyisoprenoid-binding protein YceI
MRMNVMKWVVAAVVCGGVAGASSVGASGGTSPERAADADVAPANPVRFDLDPAHTQVGFTVRHLAVTNVRGRFTRFSGHVMLDEADVTRSTVEVVIDAASIDTDNERRDEHLRSADFFEAERFPNLRFVGRRVERSGDDLFLVGELTIRDVTREVRIPFEVSGPVNGGNGQRVLGAEGSLRINRFDYRLRWNRITEAVQVVGPEVRIDLQISARTPRPAGD